MSNKILFTLVFCQKQNTLQSFHPHQKSLLPEMNVPGGPQPWCHQDPAGRGLGERLGLSESQRCTAYGEKQILHEGQQYNVYMIRVGPSISYKATDFQILKSTKHYI